MGAAAGIHVSDRSAAVFSRLYDDSATSSLPFVLALRCNDSSGTSHGGIACGLLQVGAVGGGACAVPAKSGWLARARDFGITVDCTYGISYGTPCFTAF